MAATALLAARRAGTDFRVVAVGSRALATASERPRARRGATGAAAGAEPVDVSVPGLYAGPPDPTSHIRPLHITPPANETAAAREVRLLRQEIVHKAHVFWKDNNERFAREKAAFEAGVGDKPTPEQLSEFYRQYVARHGPRHREYHRAWVMDNLRLVRLSAAAAWQRLTGRAAS